MRLSQTHRFPKNNRAEYLAPLFVLSCFAQLSSHGQDLNWVSRFGSTPGGTTSSTTTSGDYVKEVTVDGSGNTIAVANVAAAAVFEDDVQIPISTAAGNVLVKVDPDGNYLWSHTTDLRVEAVLADAADHVFLAGSFSGTVDFDPTAGGEDLRTSLGGWDMFIIQLNADGSYNWGYHAGTAAGLYETVNDVVCDQAGNIYATGSFSNGCDFDPTNAVAVLNGGQEDNLFILSLTNAGLFNWVRGVGTANSVFTQGYSIVTGPNDVILVCGQVGLFGGGEVDINTDESSSQMWVNNGTFQHTDPVVLKLSYQGDFIWGTTFDFDGIPSDDEWANTIACNDVGEVYIAGPLESYAPANGFDQNMSLVGMGAFLVKLSANGDYLFGKALRDTTGASSWNENGIAHMLVDANNYVYLKGYGKTSFDLDPDDGIEYPASHSSFIAKYDPEGRLVWSLPLGVQGNFFKAGEFHLDVQRAIYTGGSFRQTFDFDPSSATYNLTSYGGTDAFIGKYSQDNCTELAVTIDSLSTIYCSTGLAYCDAIINGGTEPYNVVWPTEFTLIEGNSGVFEIPGVYSVRVLDINGCEDSTSLHVRVSDLDLAILANNSSICNGIEATFAVRAVDGVPSFSFVWNDNAQFTGPVFGTTTAGAVSVTVTDAAGCQDSLAFTAIASNVSFLVDSIVPITDVNLTADIYARGVSGIAPYVFAWPGATSSIGSVGSYDSAGMKTVFIYDAIGCAYNAGVYIGGFGGPSGDLGLHSALLNPFITGNGGAQSCNIAFVYMQGTEDSPPRPFYVELWNMEIDTTSANTFPIPDSIVQLPYPGRTRYFFTQSFSSNVLWPYTYLGNMYMMALCTSNGCSSAGRIIAEFLEADEVPENDRDELSVEFLCSIDPNDKIARPSGICDAHFVEMDGLSLEYTIRFQNVGEIYATNVALLDTLDPSLDPASFEVLATSHPYTAVYLLNSNVIRVQYDGILLPDSTTDEPGSHGFFTFSIRPNANTLPGTIVENSAAIYFDTNLPIITNTVHHTLVEALPDLTATLQQEDGLLITEQLGTNYSWHDCATDTVVAITTIPQFAPPLAGSYYVVVTSDGCEYTSECLIYLGFIEHGQSVVFGYPNPADSRFSLLSGEVIREVVLFDQLGRRVAQSFTNSQAVELDVSRFVAGVYTCAIRLQDERVVNWKFVIAR